MNGTELFDSIIGQIISGSTLAGKPIICINTRRRHKTYCLDKLRRKFNDALTLYSEQVAIVQRIIDVDDESTDILYRRSSLLDEISHTLPIMSNFPTNVVIEFNEQILFCIDKYYNSISLDS
jgi:hypothetical protein